MGEASVREALLQSRIESAQNQSLVVLRLTKRNASVLDALLNASALETVLMQVEAAGCEVLPDWAAGGLMLAPITKLDVEEAGMEIRAHHIIVAQQHQALVEEVLKNIPKRRRPALQTASCHSLSSR